MAEVVLDVLNDALGTQEDFGADARPAARAIEIASNRVASANASRIFRVFGRPTRATTCDCERRAEPAVPQSLFLMSDPAVLKKIESGRLKKLLESKKSDREVVDELFLGTLSRLPALSETDAALGHVRDSSDRRHGFRRNPVGPDQYARIHSQSLIRAAESFGETTHARLRTISPP